MKRRFFQIHLLTAVVGMLVAGVLLWANVRVTRLDTVSGLLWIDHKTIYLHTEQYDAMGWPQFFAGNKRFLWGPFLLQKKVSASKEYVSMTKSEFDQLKPSGMGTWLPVLTVADVQRQAPEIAARLDLSVKKEPVNYSALLEDIDSRNMLINVAVAFGLFLFVTVGLEAFLRRCERTKV